MGGLNQNQRFGASASANAHHTYNSGEGFATLPEYQPSHKAQSHQQQQQRHMAAAPKPRQHLVPASIAQHSSAEEVQASSPQQPQMVDSPTLSAGGSSNSSKTFHYNPYDTSCSRVSCQSQQSTPPPVSPRPQFPDHAAQMQSVQMDHHQSQQQQYPPEYYHQNQNQHQYPEYHEQVQEEAPAKSILPYGTLHGALENYVSFIPYPTEEFVHPNPPAQTPQNDNNMCRVFLGQLPYQVTDMQLDWLCYTFGQGGSVQFPERITKHDPMRGCKVPTGCIHAYADNETVAAMLNSMHKKILVDDTGVWFAENPNQQGILNDYCMMMKNDRTKRYQNRPYDTVVAQFATSSFVRRR